MTSRPESQTQYGRRRSNTAQSVMRNAPASPLKVGDSKILNAWVHDNKESLNIMFNQAWWPGVAEGDMLHVMSNNSDGLSAPGFVFIVTKEDGLLKLQLQLCIPKPIADVFGLRNNGEVIVTKVDKAKCCAEYIELIFQDQYLGRNDMWRLGKNLVGQCVYTEQEIPYIGTMVAKIRYIYIGGKQVSSGYVTSSTKTIYRSLSAKVTIFIQVCRELWEFAGDGERYNEKIVHSFLPALFAKWREAGTNHTVTIILISRVYYDQSETDYAAGPLRVDEEGGWYKDFYKVITDLEVVYEWKPMLVSLKDSFLDFQRDILLTHHHHRASLDSALGPEQVRLVGHLSFAHDGPILEALNLGLNPTETHYIDRSLSLTGSSTIIITPGTGYFRVSKQLLRLTTTRVLDQGFGVDLICLTKPPLHQSPIMSFQGMEPELKMDRDGSTTARAMDPLWGGDDDLNESVGRGKTTFWWEPFWMTVSFWDKQMDLPFRLDRFIARAKMHEVQMLGLLEHDVLSSIEVPFLSDHTEPSSESTPPNNFISSSSPSAAAANTFDLDVFSLKTQQLNKKRVSTASSASGTVVASSYRSSIQKRLHRNSTISASIPPIEESPRQVITELPSNELSHGAEVTLAAGFVSELSTSPSQSSVRSIRSNQSSVSNPSSIVPNRSRLPDVSQMSLASKFTPNWLFKPFRSAPVAPQASPVSVSVSPHRVPMPAANLTLPPSSVHVFSESKSSTTNSAVSKSPKPMTIKNTLSSRATRDRAFDDDSPISHRRSPLNTPPRDESSFGKRRSGTINSFSIHSSNSPPISRSNPSRPQLSVSYAQSSLARRWQHVFPQPLSKHEIKWKSMVTPGCLPLTVEHFPTTSELASSYDVSSWHFIIDPHEMRSFLVNPPTVMGNTDEIRRAWARAVMRGMAAVRLAQGFQFVLRTSNVAEVEDRSSLRRGKIFVTDDDMTPRPAGAAEVLDSNDPIFLSMSNEIHRISYTGESIQVRRYVRRMPPTIPFEYQCLIWPKLGCGYTELATSFTPHGLENYGWNRLDMLIAGYEHQFNESLRYWRTRFVVIPTAEPPSPHVGPSGEWFNDEETRLLGIDKLAELFTKLRWRPPEEKTIPPAPVRFLPTTLPPELSVLDEGIIAQLDEIHAMGPLRKKMKSERDIGDMSLSAIAKAMREEDGVRIKLHKWHTSQYPDSFIGFDFVSWLVREFRDVSSRAQGTEWGIKLLEQGLFDHCRGQHGFLDGHYFYRLKGEYAVPMTPRRWFMSGRKEGGEDNPRSGHYSANTTRTTTSPRRNRKRLILSQSMVIDVDPNKRSDQAETVILHHDILHNPASVFHFELQWIGTSARCIDDQLRQWGRSIERYGLKLVEAYVTEISDIRERNAFQSCFPVRLAIPPPVIPDLDKRIPDGMHPKHFFEVAILRRFGFVLDVEAAEVYPDQIDVVYSYGRSAHRYTQYVHRSGMAFVQILGGSQGFLYLTNRLVGPGRMGTALKSKEYRPTAASEEIRTRLHQFCSDGMELTKFYDEELALLGQAAPEEPPPLSI